VDSGQWTVDSEQWTVDSGQWTVDSYPVEHDRIPGLRSETWGTRPMLGISG